MPSLADLLVKVGIDSTGLTKGLKDVSDQFKAVDKEARGLERAFAGFEKIGARLTGVGTALTAGLTLPIAAVGGAATKLAADFESSFNKVSALGGITGHSLDKLKAQALDLGAKTAFSAQQAADGMAVFASAGFNAEKIYSAMPGTLDLAAAGQIAVAEAATLTKDVLGQFGFEADKAGRVADILAQASLDTSAKMGELGTTLTYVGPVARGAGQSIEETVASIIALDAAGIRGEKAGTGLRGVLGSLLAPSKEAAGYIEHLGVKIADAEGKVRPLSDIMGQFRTELAKVATETERQNILFQIFGRESGNAAQILINTGAPALDAFEKKLVDSAGAADRVAKQLNQGFAYAMDQFKGSVETAGIALGNTLLPAGTRLLDLFTKLVNDVVLPAVNWFSKLPKPIQDGALAFAALAAAIGPVVFIAGQLMSSVSSIAAGIGVLNTAMESGSVAGNLLKGVLSNLGVAAAIAGAAIAAGMQLSALRDELVQTAQAIEVNTGLWASLKLAFSSTDSTKPAASLQAVCAELRKTAAETFEAELAWKRFTSAFSFKGLLEAATGPLGALTKLVRDLGENVEFLGGKYVSMEKQVVASSKNLQKSVSDKMKAQLDAAMADVEATKQGKKLAEQQAALVRQFTNSKEATKKLAEETSKSNGKLRDFLDTHPVLAEKLRIVEGEYKKNVTALAQLQLAIERGQVTSKLFVGSLQELEKVTSSLAGEVPQVSKQMKDILVPSLSGVTVESDKLKDALSKLGITGSLDLKKIAEEAAKARDIVISSKDASTIEKSTAVYKALKAQVEAAIQAGQDIPRHQRDMLGKLEEELKVGKGADIGKATNDIMQQVSTVWTNFAQGMAKTLFDGDMSFGEKFKQLWKDLKTALVSSFVEPATKALGDFLSGIVSDLLGGKGFGGMLSQVKELGSSIADIFGGGASAAGSAAGSAGSAGSAVGGVGGGAGSAGSAVSAGAMGIANLISGIVSAVGSVVNAAVSIRQEGTLNAIEESTRYSKIFTQEILERGVNMYLAELPIIRNLTQQFVDHHAWRIHDVWGRLGELVDVVRFETNPTLWGIENALAGGGRMEVHNHFEGATFRSQGDIDYAIDQISRNIR